jgi:hypothetical protein
MRWHGKKVQPLSRTNVASLDHVLDDNGSLPVDAIGAAFFVFVRERTIPTHISQCL